MVLPPLASALSSLLTVTLRLDAPLASILHISVLRSYAFTEQAPLASNTTSSAVPDILILEAPLVLTFSLPTVTSPVKSLAPDNSIRRLACLIGSAVLILLAPEASNFSNDL